jgi:PAS domain S-box-containing protein
MVMSVVGGSMTREPKPHSEGGSIRNLEISDESFRLLVECVKDYAIFLLDPQGHVMTWNPGAEALKGYQPDDIIGRYFGCFYEEGDAAHGKPGRLLQQALKHGRVEDEGWRVRKDGSRFWADVVITALFDKQGRLRGFAKITRDLTERRQAEQRLEQRVEERTAELQATNARLHETVRDLELFHDAVIDRELKMIDLEKRIAELEAALTNAGIPSPASVMHNNESGS